MATNTPLNDFSMLCRLFGNLFYRPPQDEVLAPIFNWLQQGSLTALWALDTDSQSEKALQQLQSAVAPQQLATEYHQLFGENGAVCCKISAYSDQLNQFIEFRQLRAMPELDNADHVAHLLLSASWLEDHAASLSAQQTLFEQFLLPVVGKFLGKVEAHDQGFYRAAAQLCRDALAAMADELEEEQPA
ncbi:molecular chaperone [Testudinibacter sp. TR-2022]|uniref:TorD/DmsD family molecular chaperone n=1 Tax=Testudinibacter sp. TR-2022 TaxID=2585029 RepID=UPI001119E074|nr:molecular chaperone [Testudinibacter sp. TR-2022]TNH04981.1 molecular chaperone [Pasteurellaceae bacterium Phil31]TNH09332.1 molecular chaperone [Testudinibacter sp. TR-2022]TNH09614.1 molecular chaperone [Testudinibacter sp. TR-2022]TNH13491.1 molecular chaperone [Testudinibacter sp. TR-2022]TNH19140.1 molecular chaperone [Testudinibacter sp. TR-2022]